MRKESFEWEDDLREQKWSMERNTLLTYQRTTTFPIDNLPLPRANPSPGRQITNGMIRQAGYWLMGGHGMVAKALGSCKTCKKPKLACRSQMSGLMFLVLGTIYTRKTRGGVVQSKRWGLLFTCLSSRAVHIELLESMDASSFVCALRRFFAICGPAAVLRKDRGTSCIRGRTELHEVLLEMELKKFDKFTTRHGCEWKLYPPQLGGV